MAAPSSRLPPNRNDANRQRVKDKILSQLVLSQSIILWHQGMRAWNILAKSGLALDTIDHSSGAAIPPYFTPGIQSNAHRDRREKRPWFW